MKFVSSLNNAKDLKTYFSDSDFSIYINDTETLFVVSLQVRDIYNLVKAGTKIKGVEINESSGTITFKDPGLISLSSDTVKLAMFDVTPRVKENLLQAALSDENINDGVLVIPKGIQKALGSREGNKSSDLICGFSSVKVPDTLLEVGEYCLSNYIGNTLDLSNTNIVAIGKSAFWRNNLLKTLILSDTIKTIKSDAFFGSSIVNINLDNVLFVDDYAFSNSRIKSINLVNVECLGSFCFENCIDLESVYIGSELKILSSGAFTNCISLKELKLPKNIEIIYDDSFKNCNLTLELEGDVTVVVDKSRFKKLSRGTYIVVGGKIEGV